MRSHFLAGTAVLGALSLAGCGTPAPELTAPQITLAPYETPQGEVILAVAPLRNESGTTAIDPLTLGDKVVAALEEVRGVRCLPLNRTLETMRALKMQGVAAQGDVAALASAMGVDGVVIGSITAYDPYTPTIGLSLVLWARPGSPIEGGQAVGGLDAHALQSAVSEPAPSRARKANGAVASASEHLDGKNHQVLMDVRSYAFGRHNPKDAMNWRRYVSSMPLYEEFAAGFVVSRLMQQEWMRLGRSVPLEGAATASAAEGRPAGPKGE